jgi:hypothetical protein
MLLQINVIHLGYILQSLACPIWSLWMINLVFLNHGYIASLGQLIKTFYGIRVWRWVWRCPITMTKPGSHLNSIQSSLHLPCSPINLILCHRCHCWVIYGPYHLVTRREPMGWVATLVIYLPFCTTERTGKKVFTSVLKLRFHSSPLNRTLSTDL